MELTPKDAAALLSVTVGELAYGIRTCDAEHRSWMGFVWPETGLVTCPDWDPTDRCGGGLHVLPQHGKNDPSLLNDLPSAVWKLVAYVRTEQVVITEDGGGKCKVPRGVVLWSRVYRSLWEEYFDKEKPIWREYQLQVSQLYDVYHSSSNDRIDEYKAKVDVLWDEYEMKLDPLWRSTIAHVWPVDEITEAV